MRGGYSSRDDTPCEKLRATAQYTPSPDGLISRWNRDFLKQRPLSKYASKAIFFVVGQQFCRGGTGDRLGVSDAAFARFAAAEITPRFPDGLTVIDAKGQWRDSDRDRIVREPSKLVKIVFVYDPQRRANLDAISTAYKTKFRQQAVLTSLQPSCVTF